MKDLKILKTKSEQAAKQFGGLYHKFLWRVSKSYHFLIPHELGRGEDWSFDFTPKLPPPVATAFGRSSENKKDSQDVPRAVCLLKWNCDLYSHDDSSAYLIKPAPANWDSNSALYTLDSLAKKIIPYTSQIEIGSNNDPLYKFLNNNNFRGVDSYSEKLLLILHIFMKSDPFPLIPKSRAKKIAEVQKDKPYVRTIDDVFLSFALLCETLLDDTNKTLLKKRKPVKKAIKKVIDEYPDLKHKEKALTGKVNEKLESWGYKKTKQEVIKSTLYRLRKGEK